MPRSQPLTELALIAQLRARAGSSRHLKQGIGDDCAVLTPPRGHDLLVTTDMSLEARHFRRDWHPGSSAGHRALARGLSDLAAMGAQPLAAFLSLAVPRSLARKPGWLNGFLDGLLALAAEHGVPLAGGDTAESPSVELLADIILLGSAPTGRALRRSGARPGDRLYITGTLGGAAAELALLHANPAKFRRANATDTNASQAHPHLFPQPRLAVGQALLRRRLATACIDVSDGLSTDLAHLCEESRVSALVDAAQLPLHPLLHALTPQASLHAALHGGEDYELLFTARPDAHVPRSIAGVHITCIGSIAANRKARPQVTLIDANRRPTPLAPQGWQHLS